MDDFTPNERVVCISDRCPGCKGKLARDIAPTVGEIYTVKSVGWKQSDCTSKRILVFVSTDRPDVVWPQDNFKRLPEAKVSKTKVVSEPTLEKA